MKLKNGKIIIVRKEMKEIRKMDHAQLESCLTEVMRMGYTESEAERDLEIRMAVEENNFRWKQAVQAAVGGLKGIGEKRRRMLTESLEAELEKVIICTK